ncbi:hypothetical protein ACIBKY_24210 [Nonomuraea sp. NPDC050394]|uniref:hypothetical protein n=1 Tax=Nonomuraea sp. NPDC050394 TaxID=3364363 RepID=UPI00378A4561
MKHTKKLAAAFLTAAVLSIGAPATAHAASASAQPVPVSAAAVMSGSSAELAALGACSRAKGWKMRLACEALVRAGGLWVWKKLEQGARGGWNTYSDIFENDVPYVYKKIIKKLKRPIYCALSRSC